MGTSLSGKCGVEQLFTYDSFMASIEYKHVLIPGACLIDLLIINNSYCLAPVPYNLANVMIVAENILNNGRVPMSIVQRMYPKAVKVVGNTLCSPVFVDIQLIYKAHYVSLLHIDCKGRTVILADTDNSTVKSV